MSAGIGVDLGPVQRHRAHLQNAHLPRQSQNLDEQALDLLQEARANVAMVSWSGWSFAAIKRNATKS